MKDVVVGHDPHALVHRLLPRDKDHRAGHDLADRGFLRKPSLEDDLAGIVALRKDPHQLALGYHQQSPDAVLRHLLDGFVNRLLRRDGHNCVAGFLRENGVNVISKAHGSTWRVTTLCRGILHHPGKCAIEFGVKKGLASAAELQTGLDGAFRSVNGFNAKADVLGEYRNPLRLLPRPRGARRFFPLHNPLSCSAQPAPALGRRSRSTPIPPQTYGSNRGPSTRGKSDRSLRVTGIAKPGLPRVQTGRAIW